jgi:D-alanyl-D-alanine endopeptidase (penicillin-binding protein 7)
MAGTALADPNQGSVRKVNIGIKSGLALVIDQETGEVLYSKNTDEVAPIASITKLMTAIVIIHSFHYQADDRDRDHRFRAALA